MDMTRYLRSYAPQLRFISCLFPSKGPAVILDIGACEGGDSVRFGKAFPEATIHAFEPLEKNQKRLCSLCSTHGVDNLVLNGLALSDEEGEADFFVSSGTPEWGVEDDWDHGNKSSSLLAPGEHLQEYPWIKFERTVTVRTRRLDNYLSSQEIAEVDFVHMDVQGAELQVLRGAGDSLARIKAIWLEVSAVSLYENQPLKPEVESFLLERGFRKLYDTVGTVCGDQFYVNRNHFSPKPALMLRLLLVIIEAELRRLLGSLRGMSHRVWRRLWS
jgi:FkbM family methyltransferase